MGAFFASTEKGEKMARYIDADVLKDKITDICKDCKHFHDGIYNVEYWMECDECRIALSSDDWFCADGERREDGEIH